jgi:uncharacterized protein DUF397
MQTEPERNPVRWHRSSYSNGQGGACVEVAPGFAAVPVRDSKDPSLGNLTVSRSSWSTLLTTLRTT